MANYDIDTLLAKFEELAGVIFDKKVAEQKIIPTVYATNLAEFEIEEMPELNGEAPITHHKFRDFLRWLDLYFDTHAIKDGYIPLNNILKWDSNNKYYTPYAGKSYVGTNAYLYYGTDFPDGTYRVNFNGDWYTTGLYSRSLEIGNYIFYRGGSPTGSILNIRNFSDDYTIPRIANHNEVTVSLSVVDSEGEDNQLMDIYNMKYSDPKMGIRMFARDTNTTFRPFRIEYSYNNIEYQAITILPRTTKTANDTEVQIGNVLSLKDTTTFLTRDDSLNMSFKDAIGGPYTLDYLAKRLSIGTANGLSLNSDTYTLSLGLASVSSAGACPQLPGDSTKALRGDGTWGNGISSDNILKWDDTNNYYRPYTDKTEAGGSSSGGKFYSGTTAPTNTNRLNYDGYFFTNYLYSYNGINSSLLSSYTGTNRAGLFSRTFSVDNTMPIVSILKLSSATSLNTPGAVLELADNSSTTNTNGAVLSGIINTTERFYLHPRSTSLAYKFDTSNTLTSGSIARFSNNLSNIIDLQYDGSINLASGAIYKINGVSIVHDAVTLGTPRGLSLVNQQLSLSLADTLNAGACPQLPGDNTKVLLGDGSWGANGVTPVSDLLYWDNTNKYYTPYATKEEVGTNACFYAENITPDNTAVNYITFNGVLQGYNIYGNMANQSYGLGGEVLNNITTGTQNIGLGQFSLNALTSGNANVGLGRYTLGFLTTGSYNTAIGNGALVNNESGSSNTAIGTDAGTNNILGSLNVFIGNRAGYNETGSNKLYISNSDTSTPLILGDFLNNTLTLGTHVEIQSDGSINIPSGTYYKINGTPISLHDAVTLGTANGLSLATQQLSLSLATTSGAGACPQLPGNTTTFLRGDGSFATVATHDAVTLGYSNGLSLNNQQLSLSLVSTSSSGACPQLSGNTNTFLRGDGSFATTHDAVTLGTANGLSLATQQLSLSLATTSGAGACPQLPGNTTTFLRGDGTWVAPNFVPSYANAFYATGVSTSFQGGDYYAANTITNDITISSTGTYQVIYGGLSNNSGTGYSYEIALTINGTAYTTKVAYCPQGIMPFSMCFVYDLTANDVVVLRVKPSGTLIANATFNNIYLTLNRIS